MLGVKQQIHAQKRKNILKINKYLGVCYGSYFRTENISHFRMYSQENLNILTACG